MLASPLPTSTCSACPVSLLDACTIGLKEVQCAPHRWICAERLCYVHSQQWKSAAGAARRGRGAVAIHWKGRGRQLLCNRERAAVLGAGLLWLWWRWLISGRRERRTTGPCVDCRVHTHRREPLSGDPLLSGFAGCVGVYEPRRDWRIDTGETLPQCHRLGPLVPPSSSS